MATASSSSSSTLAFTSYVAKVDGFNNAAVCASSAYFEVFYKAYVYGTPANCQPKTTAPAYGSCLCSKDYDQLLTSAMSSCYSFYSCTGTETSQVQSLFSAFCSSATVAVRALAAGSPASTAATTTASTLPSASTTSTAGTTSATSLLTSVSAGSTIPTTITTTGIDSTSNTSSSSTGLSTGAIVGIAIGAVVVAGILVSLIFYCGARYAKRNGHGGVGKQENMGYDMAHMSPWETASNQPHVQRPDQGYVGHSPRNLSHPTSPHQQPQRDAIGQWAQNQPGLYQMGAGPQSQQSGTMAPSQIFSDGSRRWG